MFKELDLNRTQFSKLIEKGRKKMAMHGGKNGMAKKKATKNKKKKKMGMYGNGKKKK